MGSACCVAARDRTITDQSVSDVMPRNDRYSPSWSFRWDNRGRVAGEESSMNCFSDGAGMNNRLDNKSHTTVGTAHATEEGSPLDSSRSLTWQKSPPSEENGAPQSVWSEPFFNNSFRLNVRDHEIFSNGSESFELWLERLKYKVQPFMFGKFYLRYQIRDPPILNILPAIKQLQRISLGVIKTDERATKFNDPSSQFHGNLQLFTAKHLSWCMLLSAVICTAFASASSIYPLNSKNLPEGKETRRTQVALELSPTKILTPTHSVSSFSASPLSSSQGHLMPLTSLTPSRWPRRSPGHHLLRQVSDSRIRGIMSPNFSISEEGSPFMHPGWSNKSHRGSHGGSSDGWSIPAFPELATTSNRDRWSFDSDSLSFSRDRISRSSGRVSSSPSIDMQMCGVCSKLLTEKSVWRGQKGIVANGYPIVAVLYCGHVYHAECLESMTPEINTHDPACPVCTFGEKKVLKLSEKALATDMDLKAKISKKLRNRSVDGGDSVVFKNSGSRMGSSSSMKSSTGSGKPFLKRHFSFGNKWSRSLSDNSSRKKRFFWTKSSKE
ncbi:hypothetical protein OSB04_006170 [Centaurea solstitialis]|uniref:RING-type domain-containing protein n=1 Tax=Centaurea solstitialis TaxID=347529 RepID=A0AA38TU42_9ASTR|nr:hypothetical protein OSB04_006170 [Centaurea solstitialis]